MLAYRTVCHFLNSIKHEHEQYAFNTISWNQLCVNENPPQIYDPNNCFHVESLSFKVWNLKYPIFSSKSEAPARLSRNKHYRLFQLQESQ